MRGTVGLEGGEILICLAFILVFAILAGMIPQEAYASPQEESNQTEGKFFTFGIAF